MNYDGILVGAGAFLIIGLLHPVVVRAEYAGKRFRPVFLAPGTGGFVAFPPRRGAPCALGAADRGVMKRRLLMICGWVLVALGAIGIAVPILPTTPFMLLAAACFSASSKKAYAFLTRNRFFGPYIEHYRTKRGVSVGAKVRAILLLWTLLCLSALAIGTLEAALGLGAVGIGVTAHLLLLKTRPREGGAAVRGIRAKE